MHINNWNPNTYLWILEDCDIPYIRDEWNKLLQKYGQNPKDVTGMTILDRYLSKMQLKHYHNYRWEDTKYLQEAHRRKLEQDMRVR